MAGNQLGKCRTYDSEVQHPDGSVSLIGELFDAATAFDVLAWNGSGLVSAPASHVIKKPAEECVEVFLSNGASFKASLQHVILTGAGWLLLERHLGFVPILPRSNSGRGQQVRVSSARNWFQRAVDLTDRCFQGFRQCGERPHQEEGAGQFHSPSQGGVQQHSRASSPLDVRADEHSNSGQPLSGLPSSWCGVLLNAVQSAAFLARVSYTRARSRSVRAPFVGPLLAVLVSLLRSAVAVTPGQWSKNVRALVSPGSDDVRIIAYKPIGVHDLYDMTVPVFGNYWADGIVHHNTVAGSFEWAMHLTGKYPDWWLGRRFDMPGRYWAAGESGVSTRDTVQKLLVGPPEREEEWGTGSIPFSDLIDTQRGRSAPDALDSIVVKHVSGGSSTLLFKSYEQGRAKWQGDTLNGVWFDEEPPVDIYTEGLTRTNATDGITMITFTPLKGMSEVVMMFLTDADMQELK